VSHAKSHIRKHFAALVAELASPDGSWFTPKPCPVPAPRGHRSWDRYELMDWLALSCNDLWNCTDQLPRHVAGDVDVIVDAYVIDGWSHRSRRTYAAAARALKGYVVQMYW
jgi:hypothetical protein